MSFTYVSEETGENVTVECRFCRKFKSRHVPAIKLAGQWEGGDIDIDPHWVPVCKSHFDKWHDSEEWFEGKIPERYRLIALDL